MTAITLNSCEFFILLYILYSQNTSYKFSHSVKNKLSLSVSHNEYSFKFNFHMKNN